MVQLLRLLCGALIGLLRSAVRREAEILALRHQINVLRRKSPSRPALSNVDRLLFVLLILQHGRRQILCLGVTAHPTVEWIARQWRLELVSKQKRKAALVECVRIFHLWPMTALLHFENGDIGN